MDFSAIHYGRVFYTRKNRAPRGSGPVRLPRACGIAGAGARTAADFFLTTGGGLERMVTLKVGE